MKQLPTDSSDRVRVESSHTVARRIRWKQLFWVLLVAATAIVIGVVVYVGPLGTLGHFIMSLSEDTEFAPGYSERVFQQIAIGDAEASAIFKSRVAKWLHYSHSPGSTHYRQRFIGIDRNGKVCRKRSEFYWD